MNIFAPHAVDGYKLGHAQQDAAGLTLKYSNLTPRSNRLFKAPKGYDGKLVVFGPQGAFRELVEMWDATFFSQPKEKAIARYKRRVDLYLGEGVIDVGRMEALHDLGYLPLQLKTLDEGSRVPMQVPILTLRNTLPEFAWLVNYFETALSAMVWKSCTNAEVAYQYKRLLTSYAEKTGSPLELVQFQGHDFSARGMSGIEDAARTGASHLTSFSGTDTVAALDYVEDYYVASADIELVGVSVPATEHAVSSINILAREKRLEVDLADHPETLADNMDFRLTAETEFLKDLITVNHPSGIVSYVADTYDYWGVLTRIVPALKETILARDGKLVIRPDSGDPVDIVCGTAKIVDLSEGSIRPESYEEAQSWAEDILREQAHNECEHGQIGPDSVEGFFSFEGKIYHAVLELEYNRHDKQYYYIDGAELINFEEAELTAEQKGSIQVLWETFGGTITETGHKLLDSHIGLIYGDSITLERAEAILAGLEAKGFASGNVVFGVGSFTYQYCTRDTFGMAMKATGAVVNGEFIEVYKDPKTGASKKSAKGLLYVGKDETTGNFYLEDQVDWTREMEGELRVRFANGTFYNQTTLEEVRARLK